MDADQRRRAHEPTIDRPQNADSTRRDGCRRRGGRTSGRSRLGDCRRSARAAAQEAESPPIINTAPLITPEGGMGGRVDIDWTGPVAPLIEKIAKMTNYRVKFLGNEPAIPIIVTVAARNTVLAEIMQNASFQAGKRAHILVFPDNHVIEVRYLPA